MSYSQYPSSAPEQKQVTPASPSNNKNKIIIIALSAALLVAVGFIFWSQSNNSQVVAQYRTQIMNVDSARNDLQNDFNEVSKKLDELNGTNIELQGALAEKNSELEGKKAELVKKQKELSSLMKKNKLTVEEYNQAKALIAELNTKILDYESQIAQLKEQNASLVVERDNLVTEKTQIQETLTATEAAKKSVEDVASTLHASNISIAAINVKSSGKEVTTSTAKRADLMRIGFDVDENRLASSGTKQMYVIVTAPDGTVISNGETFTTREEGDKKFTSKVDVNYEQGKKIPVNFDWKQETKYQTGDYKIEIYHNGYKIGEGRKALKKGGLFS